MTTSSSHNNSRSNSPDLIDTSSMPISQISSKRESQAPLQLTAPKQQRGAQFERAACEYLQQQGLTLIADNWHKPGIGEIDLIMMQPGQAWSTLVFIEVRYRKSSPFGDAVMSVTAAKQRKIIKTAQYFLQANPQFQDVDIRFDVIAYNDTCRPEWLKGAFMAQAW